MKKIKKIFLFLILCFFTKHNSWANPQMIRHGYFNCLGCHYAAEGGSLLTPYGQGISSTMSVFSSDLEEEIAIKKLHHSVQFRAMGRDRISPTTSKQYRVFPMQADYLNQINWTANLRQEVILAEAPTSSKQRGVDGQTNDANKKNKATFFDRLYLRTAKLEWTYDKGRKVALGEDILPLGLGLVDHTSYVRERNRLGVTDVPFILQHFIIEQQWQLFSNIFLANPNDRKMNREKGLAFKAEYAFLRNLSLGGQALATQGHSIDRRLLGILGRWGIPQFSILTEHNATQRLLAEDKSRFWQRTHYVEVDYFPRDYLKVFGHGQLLRVAEPFYEKEKLAGIGIETHWQKHISTVIEWRKKWSSEMEDRLLLAQLFVNWW